MPIPVLLTPVIGTIQSSIVDTIKSIFGTKAWSWRLIVEQNRKVIGGFFTVLTYMGMTSRVQYWFDTFTATKGIDIDAGENYLKQLHLETVNAAIKAGISTAIRYPSFSPGSIGQTLYELGYNTAPVTDQGQWSVPASLTGKVVGVESTGIADKATQVLAGIGGSGTFNIILLVLMVGVLVFLLFTKRK